MFDSPQSRSSRALQLAIATSLLVHGLLLLVKLNPPEQEHASPRLEASLAPPPAPRADIRPRPKEPVKIAEAPPRKPQQAQKPKAKAPESRPRILTARKSNAPAVRSAEPAPTWSVAQKEEMDNFLNDLARDAKKPPPPPPTLAERSMAMAREIGREQMRESRGRSSSSLEDLVERIPNSPPVDPFSLEFYMDALVKKLNRSAAFVKNDPRTRGIRNASIEVRLNPDGSLKSFKVVNAGDQQDEIAFVKSVVERAIPFSAFPPDIVKSAKSLALMICIQPPSLGGGSFGFTRRPDGSGC